MTNPSSYSSLGGTDSDARIRVQMNAACDRLLGWNNVFSLVIDPRGLPGKPRRINMRRWSKLLLGQGLVLALAISFGPLSTPGLEGQGPRARVRRTTRSASWR